VRPLLLSAVSGDGVLRFVGPDPVRHLILQMELPLFQRLLFELFFDVDVGLEGQLVESRLTLLMLFGPVPELGILIGENALNVRGTIRHRLSSFEVPSSQARF
jgi:hypothetical protein